MKRAATLLAVPAAALPAWLLLGGAPSADASSAATFVSLLAWQLCAMASLVVGLSFSTTGSLWGIRFLGLWGLHAVASYVPAQMLLSVSSRGDFVLCQAAFHALIASAWLLERLMIRSRAGVFALLAGSLALAAPAGLDEWIGDSRDLGRTAAVIERALSHSPPVAACSAALDWDLFRQERVYRAYRLGETLHRAPSLAETAEANGRVSLMLLLAAGLTAAGRFGLKRRS